MKIFLKVLGGGATFLKHPVVTCFLEQCKLKTTFIMYKLLTRLGCSPVCSSCSEQRLVFFTAVWYRVMKHLLHTVNISDQIVL